MADFSAIRAGIKTRLDTISGLRASASIEDKPELPAAMVRPLRMNYHQSMGAGANAIPFEVVVLVTKSGGSARGQALLDAYLDDSGANSIKAAIEGDKTLGGTCSTLTVQDWRDYGQIEWNDVSYIGARVDVEVWA